MVKFMNVEKNRSAYNSVANPLEQLKIDLRNYTILRREW